jgi:Tfp pilus assembly protein FimT
MRIRHGLTGFSLAELLLVMAMLAVVVGLGAPVYLSAANRNERDVATNLLVQDLYRAQVNSRAVTADKNWGVAVNGQTVTLFRGASYAARDQAFDDNYDVPRSISLAGTSQIVYDKLTGWPQTTGSFSLQSKTDNRTVTINGKGMVDY